MRLAAFLALTPLLLFAGDPDAARAALAEADLARDRGDWTAADASYTRALESEPDLSEAWHGRAMSRRRLGRLKEALADLRRAVELAPESGALRHDLGLTLLDSGEYQASIFAYDEALRLAPDSAVTYNNRALAKRLSGDMDGALADITMAIQLDTGYARAYRHRALCLYNLGEWEDSLADFETAVRLEPAEQDHAHLRMWLLRARLGRRDDADRALRGWLESEKPDGFTARAAKFLLGEATRDELLEAARGADKRASKVLRCEAHFLAASRALVDGDAEEARTELEAAREATADRTEITRSVEAELKRLEPSK